MDLVRNVMDADHTNMDFFRGAFQGCNHGYVATLEKASTNVIHVKELEYGYAASSNCDFTPLLRAI